MSRLDERPWFKFRVDRWLGDVELQSCSPAAQGLWINLLAFMHGSREYGHLLHKGKPAGAREIAKMLPRWSAETIGDLLTELEGEGVFSRRAADRCIFSRRMVRDYAKAVAGRNAKIGALDAESGDLFGDEKPLEGNLEGDLEGHKRENKRENKKEKKTLPPSPPQAGGMQDEGFHPDDEIPIGKQKRARTRKPAPPQKPIAKAEPEKPARSRRRVCKLPADWMPREDEATVARAELKLSASEFADATGDFREWATNTGRRIGGDAEPNWDLAFRNSLRSYAARIKSPYRRDTPPVYAKPGAAVADASLPTSPEWWAHAAAIIAEHNPTAWKSYGAGCAATENEDGENILTAATSIAADRLSAFVTVLEPIIGFPIFVKRPEPQKAQTR